MKVEVKDSGGLEGKKNAWGEFLREEKGRDLEWGNDHPLSEGVMFDSRRGTPPIRTRENKKYEYLYR